MAINLNINSLTPKQLEVLRDNSRFKVLVCGRRGGKTAIHQAQFYKNFLQKNNYSMFIAPSRKQGKRIFWDRFASKMPEYFISQKNISELKYTSITNSQFLIEGHEAGESVRGSEKVHHFGLDEFDDQSMNFLDRVVIPAVADTNGSIIVTGTPKGYSYLYELSQRKDFKFFKWTTSEGGLVSQEEVERAKTNLDEKTFRQEYEASFENYTGFIFYGFSDKNIVDIEYDESKPHYLSFDFNERQMSCVVYEEHDIGWIAVKELTLKESNTHEFGIYVRDRIKNVVGLTGDYSGIAKKTSAKRGVTDWSILEGIFGVSKWLRHTKVKQDQFNTVNSALSPIKGSPKFYISKDCKELINTYRRISHEDYKKGLIITDLADASIYQIWRYLPIE